MEVNNRINYYVEPVEIEIYLKKAGKVRTIVKDLFIELIDVEPINEHSEKIFIFFREKKEPIDLMELMNQFPEYMPIIYEAYYHHFSLFEKLSMHFKAALTGSIDSLRQSMYFTELLLKYEPTIVTTKYIGDFQTYNLNYLIRWLNREKQLFLLEDSTVIYLIKRRNKAHEGRVQDKEFNKLVELWEYNAKRKKF